MKKAILAMTGAFLLGLSNMAWAVEFGSGSAAGLATSAAPTLTEGAPAGFSFDLEGNARFILDTSTPADFNMATLLSGEDQTNNLLMTGSGITRITTFSSVTSATTSSITTVPSGPKTFMAEMASGASESVAFDLTIYGNWQNSATGKQEVCRIWVPASTTTDAIQEKCPPVTDAYTYWLYTATVYTSASGRNLTVYAMY